MGELISRKAVIRLLAQEASHKAMQGFTADARGLIKAKEYVSGLPTAYSIDEVVEQLENDTEHTFHGCINKQYAISIVKGAVKE